MLASLTLRPNFGLISAVRSCIGVITGNPPRTEQRDENIPFAPSRAQTPEFHKRKIEMLMEVIT